MTAAKKPATLCCVNIGFKYYLLPAEKGMKLVELMQSAFECEKDYADHGYVYHVGKQPEHLALEIVRPSQVRQPKASTADAPRALPAPRRIA